MAENYLDAEKKIYEARRNPDAFKKSAIYANLLQRATNTVANDMQTMSLPPAAKQRAAQKMVESWMGQGEAAVNKAQGTVPAAPAAPALPPAAVSQLKEGEVTTFANGQKWTLRGGKPVQVP